MTRTFRRIAVLPFALVLLTGLLAACSTTATDPGGTLQVAMTTTGSDAGTLLSPAAKAEVPTCLFIAASRVEVVPDEGSEGPILGFDVEGLPPQDLMDFAGGADVVLGAIELDDVPEEAYETAYHQVRFIVDRAEVGFDATACEEGALEPVFVPSGAQTGMKVNLDTPLTLADALAALESDVAPTIMLEFDTDRLLETSHQHPYLLTPTAVRAYVTEAEVAEPAPDPVE